MEAANIPTKIGTVWGASAGSQYINTIPVPSQQAIANGRASFTDGFPPNCFIPYASGGAGPFGGDTNGILQLYSQWLQWAQAGGPLVYDSAFAAEIGGYAQGAVIASSTSLGRFWQSLVDNNTSNPDTGGANWALAFRILVSADFNLYVNASTGNDNNNGLSSGAPFLTLQKAISVLYQSYDLSGYTVTINATGAFTSGPFLAGLVPGSSGATGIVFNFASGSTVTSTSNTFWCVGGGFTIAGSVTISNTSSNPSEGNGLVAQSGGQIQIASGSTVTFGACPVAHITANSGYVLIDGGYTVAGSSPIHLSAFNVGNIQFPNPISATVTLSGTPAFSTAFAQSSDSNIFIPHTLVTFSGSATGSRYSALLNGVINTEGGGATYLPGSTSGSTTTGGQYA